MGHIGKKSGNKRSYHKRFLILSILLGIIIIQISVTIYPSTALAVPRVNCVNTTPSNNGTSAPPAPATPGIVVINEVLPIAASQWNCTTPDSQENAWIEIYNPQNQPFDLYAARASVDQGSGGIHQHSFPFGSIIAAHGFLVIFPFPDFTSPFSLVRLLISQVVIDQVSIPSLAPDTSYARIPDGSNNWQITTTPTIASSNMLNTIITTVKATKTASQTTKAEKTKSATSTATQTTKSKSTKTQTQGNGTSNDGATTNTSSTGVQPTWSALSLPLSHANDAVANNSAQQNSSSSSISSPPPANSPAFPDKILLTSLIVAFIAALLACWRLYRWYRSVRP